MAEELGLFAAIHNMRAMRRLKPDPVPDELIHKIIAAGLGAPSGGDVQHWCFIIRSSNVSGPLGAAILEALEPMVS